jgi:hypothetical protein
MMVDGKPITVQVMVGWMWKSTVLAATYERQYLACKASKQRHSTPACKAGHAHNAVSGWMCACRGLRAQLDA